MAQTKIGAAKLAAKHYGMSLDEYLVRIETESFCNKCKKWKPIKLFGKDLSRTNGLNKKCNDCRWVNGGERGKSIKGRPSPMKGKKYSGKALENISKAVTESNKRRTGLKKKYTKEGYEKLLLAIRIPHPEIRGDNHYSWKGGTASERQKYYKSHEYRNWRRLVFERDKHTCQDCGDSKGGNLEAHHILPYAGYPEYRIDVSNGITLCKNCHEKRHFKSDSIRNKSKSKKNGAGDTYTVE